MKITMIAKTVYTGGMSLQMNEKDWEPSGRDEGIDDSEGLIEFAGRSCYLSWNKPNPKTANNPDYISHIMAQSHFSVLEHSSVSFYIEDCSRALTHELVRHRMLSPSQLSQRFVNMENTEPVIPPFFSKNKEASLIIKDSYKNDMNNYNKLVKLALADGATRKQAREAARAVLPNSAPTSIVITGNFRAYKEMLVKRNNDHADAEIHEMAAEIERQLHQIAPSVFPLEKSESV